MHARTHWEVLLAVAILFGVLFTIDTFALARPALTLTLAPLAFLVLAALVPLRRSSVVIWVGVFAALALVMADTRIVGLAYPAVALLVLLLLRRSPGGAQE